MKIVCPQCATPYEVEPITLGASGRSVRCARCHTVWFAASPRATRGFIKIEPGSSAVAPMPAPRPATPFGPGSLESVRPERFTNPDSSAPFDATVTELAAPPLQPDSAPAPSDAPSVMPGEPALAADSPPLAPLPDPAEVIPSEPIGPDSAHAASPVEPAGPESPAEAAAPANIESLAARRTGARRRPVRQKARRKFTPLWAAIFAFAAVDLAMIFWRAQVVRALPQTASLYRAIGLPVDLRGLAFEGVTTAEEERGGVKILVVQGTIASTSRRPVSVPRLRFSVRADGGHEIYTWTALPNRSRLAPGETMSFRSRLASPPPEARTIAVRFFNHGDLAAGQP